MHYHDAYGQPSIWKDYALCWLPQNEYTIPQNDSHSQEQTRLAYVIDYLAVETGVIVGFPSLRAHKLYLTKSQAVESARVSRLPTIELREFYDADSIWLILVSLAVSVKANDQLADVELFLRNLQVSFLLKQDY